MFKNKVGLGTIKGDVDDVTKVSIPLKAGQPVVRTSRQWILPDPNPNYEWIITSRTDSDELAISRRIKPENEIQCSATGIRIPNELVCAIADAMLQAYKGDNA